MACWSMVALGGNACLVVLTIVRRRICASTAVLQVLSACFWGYAAYYSATALPRAVSWLLPCIKAGMMTLLLCLSWAQSVAGDAAFRERLPATLPARTWDITLPALPAYLVTVALLVAGLGAAVFIYCSLYWRGGGALQAEVKGSRVCAAIGDIWAPMDLLMLWGAAAVAHAANVGLRRWVLMTQQ